MQSRTKPEPPIEARIETAQALLAKLQSAAEDADAGSLVEGGQGGSIELVRPATSVSALLW